jgi:hypothetical protein
MEKGRENLVESLGVGGGVLACQRGGGVVNELADFLDRYT